MKRLITILIMLIPVFAYADAQTVGDMFEKAGTYIPDINGLFGAVSYVSGIFLLIKSVLKFKDHNVNPNKENLATPILLFVASACLLCLPEAIKVSKESVGLGNSGDASSLKY